MGSNKVPRYGEPGFEEFLAEMRAALRPPRLPPIPTIADLPPLEGGHAWSNNDGKEVCILCRGLRPEVEDKLCKG